MASHVSPRLPNAPDLPDAGVAPRIAAYLIDSVLVYVAYALVQVSLAPVRKRLGSDWMKSGLLLETYTFLTISLPSWLYFAFGERSSRQATIGGRQMGLQVTDAGGEQIGFRRALLRTIIKSLPWEVGHLTINFPTPMLIDPLTGAFQWGRGEFRFGFLLSYALAGAYLVVALLHPRRRSVPDLVAGTIVRQRHGDHGWP